MPCGPDRAARPCRLLDHLVGKREQGWRDFDTKGPCRLEIDVTVDAFKKAEHAVADATGMAHAVIDRFLARHRVVRNVALRVPGLHVLPMIV